jgi:hypothetical protein
MVVLVQQDSNPLGLTWPDAYVVDVSPIRWLYGGVGNTSGGIPYLGGGRDGRCSGETGTVGAEGICMCLKDATA